MSLTKVRDLEDRGARLLAMDWFDRLDAEFGADTALARRARNVLEAHLIDALTAKADASAVSVEHALAGMGDPAQLAADWIEEHAETANARGPRLLRAIVSSLQLVGVVLSGLFVLGGLVRLFDPTAVGLFAMADGATLIGTPAGQTVAVDLLGIWTAPIFLLIGLALLAVSIEFIRLSMLRQLRRLVR